MIENIINISVLRLITLTSLLFCIKNLILFSCCSCFKCNSSSFKSYLVTLVSLIFVIKFSKTNVSYTFILTLEYVLLKMVNSQFLNFKRNILLCVIVDLLQLWVISSKKFPNIIIPCITFITDFSKFSNSH